MATSDKPKGDEFKVGETAFRFGKYEVEVLGFTKDKWWYVQSKESGLMGYTRRLTKKLNYEKEVGKDY